MIAMAAYATLPVKVDAGDHWLSRAATQSADQASLSKVDREAASASPKGAISSNKNTFDITISLQSSSPENEDPPSNREAYNARIKEFARAVYRATDGQHTIRNVTVYSGKGFWDAADVRWTYQCGIPQVGPRSHPSGYGVPGRWIDTCTFWATHDLMQTPKGSGYTLAHEWAHYAYGVFDEHPADSQQECENDNTCKDYEPRLGDTPVALSILNNQWLAAGPVNSGTGEQADGNLNYLEFSVSSFSPYIDPDCSNPSTPCKRTAQQRVYNKSGWTTLWDGGTNDPQDAWFPPRTYYASLSGNCCSSPPTARALEQNDVNGYPKGMPVPNILWAGQEVVDLLFDVSGSMCDAPIDDAKSGAKTLINHMSDGTFFGLSTFSTDVSPGAF
jgi:calcium-activated chloride channel regulator 3/4